MEFNTVILENIILAIISMEINQIVSFVSKISFFSKIKWYKKVVERPIKSNVLRDTIKINLFSFIDKSL